MKEYFFISSSISLIFCFITFLLIYLKFCLTGRKISITIFFITISDTITTIGYLLGTPNDNTLLCTIQGYLTTTFPICSICWTTITSYIIFKYWKDKNKNEMYISHKFQFIVWLSCLSYGFLPFTTSKYGCDDDDDNCWCYVTHRESNPHSIWTSIWYYSFYIILWISFFIYILLSGYVIYQVNHSKHEPSIKKKLIRQLYKLGGYPLVTVICWLPLSFIEITTPENNSWKDYKTVMKFSYLCVAIQGTLTGLLYMSTSNSYWKCCKKNTQIYTNDPQAQPRPEPPNIYIVKSEMDGIGGVGREIKHKDGREDSEQNIELGVIHSTNLLTFSPQIEEQLDLEDFP